MSEREIVQRIYAAHWDIQCCPCWVCVAARENGIGALEEFLPRVEKGERP